MAKLAQKQAVRSSSAVETPTSPHPRFTPVPPLSAAEPRREYDYASEIRLAWVFVVATLAASTMVGWELAETMFLLVGTGEIATAAGHAVFAFIVGMLITGTSCSS